VRLAAAGLTGAGITRVGPREPAAVSPGRSPVLQAPGSCRTAWPRHRRRPWRGWPDGSGRARRRSAAAGAGRRPGRVIRGWRRGIRGGGPRRRRSWRSRASSCRRGRRGTARRRGCSGRPSTVLV